MEFDGPAASILTELSTFGFLKSLLKAPKYPHAPCKLFSHSEKISFVGELCPPVDGGVGRLLIIFELHSDSIGRGNGMICCFCALATQSLGFHAGEGNDGCKGCPNP